MLVILHGDNILASRNELASIKKASHEKEIRDINGKNIPEEDIRQAVESLSLLGSSIVVIFENLFSGLGRNQKTVKTYADILSQASYTIDIILWESKEIGKTVLSQLPDADIRLYKIPLVIFEYLDSMRPGNTSQTLSLLEDMSNPQNGSRMAQELVFYMTQTRIRQLIQMKDHVTPQKVSSWQAMRLTNQAKSFTMDMLLAMHKKLIELEYSFKTGASPFTLSQLIHQLILDI